jgi:hypothetical protein
MRKVQTIRFAIPVAKVDKNFQDITWYDSKEKKFEHLEIFYDGNDFMIRNSHLVGDQINPREVYVAKTNVSQWELAENDTVGTQSDAGVPKKVRAKANA